MSFLNEEKDFLQGASASVIIPSRQDLTLNELFESDEVDQRDTIFFDERLKVYAVLEFPVCTEEVLKSYLSRIELKIDAWAVASEQGDRRFSVNNDPTRDLVASETVSNMIDPVTLVKQSEDDSKVSFNLVWEVHMSINRPRIRLLDPSVEFVPNAIIAPKNDTDDAGQYLEPFSTLEPNILGPIIDINGTENRPYFAVSRLEKVLPSKPKEEMRIRFAYTASDLIKAYQAVNARIKYKFINTHAPLPTTIASLDIDVIPILDVTGTIEKAEVSMVNGQVEFLMNDFLPMSCQSKDCITLLYKLQSLQQSVASPSVPKTPLASMPGRDIGTLTISFLATFRLPNASVANISMNWTTNIDFSQPVNPSYGPPSQPIQRTNRPSSLSFGAGDPRNAAHSASGSLQAFLPPPTFGRSLASNATDILTISFIAPDAPVNVGVPFSWRVIVVNRSPKTARLTIIPLPRVQRASSAAHQYAKRHAPKISSSSVSTHATVPFGSGAAEKGSTEATATENTASSNDSTVRHFTGTEIAKAHVDENVLYALHHSGIVPAEADIVSLTAEVRVGPLDVGQCHESEIKFMAFKAGAFTVDAIRVVDQVREAEEGVGAPGVVMDLRELPDIIVTDRASDRVNRQNGHEGLTSNDDEDEEDGESRDADDST